MGNEASLYRRGTGSHSSPQASVGDCAQDLVVGVLEGQGASGVWFSPNLRLVFRGVTLGGETSQSVVEGGAQREAHA